MIERPIACLTRFLARPNHPAPARRRLRLPFRRSRLSPRERTRLQRGAGRRSRRPERSRFHVRFRPQVGLLEQRRLLSTLYATGSGVGDGTSQVYRIEGYASAPTAVDISSSGALLWDLAVNPLNDSAYAISPTDLYSLNLNTGHATEIGALGVPGMDSLTFSPTGTLYAMSVDTTDLYTRSNVATGRTTVIFDTSFKSQGDLAFETDGYLYESGITDLVKIDLSNDTATAVGPLGVPGIVGLAVDPSGQMYGAEGGSGPTAIMFHINPMTGAATEIGVIADASSLGVTGLSFEYPLSPVPTLTTLRSSTTSEVVGQSITFIATVNNLSAGGATPNGGTVTFSDQSGALDSETLVDGVATFTASSLAAGTYTVTASYSGTADFCPEQHRARS